MFSPFAGIRQPFLPFCALERVSRQSARRARLGGLCRLRRHRVRPRRCVSLLPEALSPLPSLGGLLHPRRGACAGLRAHRLLSRRVLLREADGQYSRRGVSCRKRRSGRRSALAGAAFFGGGRFSSRRDPPSSRKEAPRRRAAHGSVSSFVQRRPVSDRVSARRSARRSRNILHLAVHRALRRGGRGRHSHIAKERDFA